MKRILIDAGRWIFLGERTVHLLNVPFVSQLGNVKRNDCGPACVVMILRAVKGFPVTIQDIYNVIRFSGDGYWLRWQLVAALQAFGIGAKKKTNPDLEKAIKEKKGIIALVNYGVIQDWEKNPNSNFRHNHFVVVYGFDRKRYYVLDPLYPKDKRRYIPKDVFNKAWETAEDANRLAVVTEYAIDGKLSKRFT